MSSYSFFNAPVPKPMDHDTLVKTIVVFFVSIFLTAILIACNYPLSADSPLLPLIFIVALPAIYCPWAFLGHLCGKLYQESEKRNRK